MQAPEPGRPWIPPPPPLALDTPIILPDRATLARAIDRLKNHQPKCTPEGKPRPPTPEGQS